MTRINTNVSSLIAQNTLSRTNNQLQTALTRLSTGLRINTGKDDPAGLIASEALRSDITALDRAIRNSERANQVIATADSALGQVSSLLNDIRGLVTEAANGGALSDDEIAANQLQIDSSLEAINRIAQTTTFQGRRLLDGSLDFLSTIGSVSTVTGAKIDQANLGATGSVDVDVDITTAATQAEITTASGAFSTNTAASATLLFRAEAQVTGFVNGNADIQVRAVRPGASMEGITIQFTADTTAVGSEYAEYDEEAATITVHLNNAAATTAANVITAINSLADFDAENNDLANAVINGANATDIAVNATTDADQIVITAANVGPNFNNLKISMVSDSGTAVGAPQAVYDSAANTLKIYVNDTGNTTIANIATEITGMAEFNAVATANGDGNVTGNTGDGDTTANTETSGGGTLLDDLVVQVAGRKGTEVFTFQAGASINQMVAALDLVSDATGVTASQSNGILTIESTEYGTKAFVNVDVISEGAAGLFESKLSASRATGTDIVASINGVEANGDGNTFSVNTSTLDVKISVDDGSSDSFEFTISGGGALFQLGPDVVSNQQARLGIRSVNTATLGGVSGRLYQLASGNDMALAINATGAASIVDEVINEIGSLRGRLGAFQRTTLETNIVSLNDTMSNLVESESTIRDADFAQESAALTRAQILVQSGTSVLAIANQNPQNVLALLR
ncbi:MAG: flagellin [Planctomycetes bacterium]|nr:flagellin [Planctomycetota bacterium]